jgi:transposase InsO family protein
VMDLTEDGRRLKLMPIVDEYSRECLTIEVERSITSEDVVSTLASLFHSRGQPAFIRSDNGPEFMAKAIKEWLEASKVKNPLHRAGVSLGKRLLGDVHQSLFRRAAKEGGVRRSIGSEGAHRGLP